MFKIKLAFGAITDDFGKLKAYCNHFNCTVEQPKRGEHYNVISTDDPTNFFWMGANINLRSTSNLTATPAERFLL